MRLFAIVALTTLLLALSSLSAATAVAAESAWCVIQHSETHVEIQHGDCGPGRPNDAKCAYVNLDDPDYIKSGFNDCNLTTGATSTQPG